MNILFVETAANGHFVNLYLNLILSQIKSNSKINISLMVTQKVYENINIDIKKKIENVFFFKEVTQPNKKNFLNLVLYQFKYYYNIKKNFIKYFSSNLPDHVYLNTFDHCDKAISVLGSPFYNISFSGIFTTTKFHLSNFRIGPPYRLNFLYKYLFKRILKLESLKYLFVIDPLLKNFFSKKKEMYYKKLIYTHDAVNTNYPKISNKHILNFKKNFFITKNSFVIIVYGAISSNKSLEELLNALQGKKFKKKIVVIVAGKQEKDISIYLNKIKKKLTFEIHILNKYITPSLEKKLFSVVDLTWIAYKKNYGSSGVYYLSAYMKKPALISRTGLIAHLNKTHKIAKRVSYQNPEDIRKLINLFINKKNVVKKKNQQMLYNTLKQKKFENTICNFLSKI